MITSETTTDIVNGITLSILLGKFRGNDSPGMWGDFCHKTVLATSKATTPFSRQDFPVKYFLRCTFLNKFQHLPGISSIPLFLARLLLNIRITRHINYAIICCLFFL